MKLNPVRWIPVLAVTVACQVVAPASATAQEPVRPGFSFAAAGDFGVGADTTATLTAMGEAGVDLALALGDLSYDGAQSEAAWCAYVTEFFREDFPFEILAGNHEDDYGEDGHVTEFAGCLPDRLSAVGAYGVQYYFDYANLARFILISPDLTVEGRHYYYGDGNAQYRWLARTIDDARDAGMPWVIVGMHKSCLSMGQYYCDIYQDLWSLLIEKRVDLVLHGHDHSYQRTHQLSTGPGCALVAVNSFNANCVADDGNDGAYPKGEGVVSVIVGTGGGDLYEIDVTDSEAGYFARWMATNADPRKGFLKVDVSRTELVGAFMGTTPTSAFSDTFAIVGSP